MKKISALICAIICVSLILCSCEPQEITSNTANYGTLGVYYEYYGLSDSSRAVTSFRNMVNYFFSVGAYDEGWDYENSRVVGDFVIGDYTDSETNDSVCILTYTGESKDVVIPEQLDGKNVVALGAYNISYDECVRLPFKGVGFRSISLPSTLKYIYAGALEFDEEFFVSEQDKISKDFTLPESINVDPDNKYFSSENGVLYSKDKSCLLCVPMGYKADEFTVPASVQYIASDAIVCENIKQLNIGKNVVGINYPSYIFGKKLESINVDEQNEKYSSEDGVLFDKNKKILLSYPSMKKDKRYALPDTAEKVAANWGYVLKTEEIVFNEGIEECQIYEQPYVYSDYNAEGVAWYSSIKKICGYRGSGFDEAVYNIRSLSDIDFEYLN